MDKKHKEQWKKLNGINDWEGLLDPLDLELRRHIIKYGEMCQAAYDAFNGEKASKYAGSSRYGRKDFFEKVGLSLGHDTNNYYKVTKFLYATSGINMPEAFIVKSSAKDAWSKESNWMGYVAVATDEGKKMMGKREIVIAWRGTLLTTEWVNNMDFSLISCKGIYGEREDDPKVHKGWLSIYTSDDPMSNFNKTSARLQVLEEVRRLVDMHENEEMSITITGHSLGAALSTLNALDIIVNGYNVGMCRPDKIAPVTAFVFASPRVGDLAFKKMFANAPKLKLLRVENALDVVPKYPFVGYEEVGVELKIDTGESPYLKSPGCPWTWHNMEVYLHGVAGTQGSRGGFELEVERDVALVNKSADALKDECLVPVSWWIVQNKGMVQGSDGHWSLMDHEEDGSGYGFYDPFRELI